MSKTRKWWRDARTGQFITIEKAKKHPSTTTIETIPNRKTKKK